MRSRFNIAKVRQQLQLSIRQQVHGTIIFFSAVSFIIIGIATILFFISRYESNNKETLSRMIRIMEKDLQASVSANMIQSTVFQNAESSAPGPLQNIVSRLSEVHGPDVNIYSLSGDLKASSLPLPYIKGIVSTKIDPVAFDHLHAGSEIQYFQKEHIGKLNFVSDYIPVTDSSGHDMAYLNIPYFTSQARLKEEISNFLVTIINLNAFIFLIAGMVALIITNRITRSFSFISDKMNKINLGHNEAITWNRNDEIGALVKEYNRMLAKLEESAAALARTERESAWQEMAKQVAHEIKNPLTPMKLSMQFLQRSIENNEPNIKELGAKVSATLVEQIDHLSRIAGEFSRFANIEKANPEVFNLNESLRSVKQLYAGDHATQFTWKLGEDPVMIRADKTHVNRILTNLILNGIQAVPAGMQAMISVEEKISLTTAEIKISDNGTGIPEAIREKIFTPNFTTKSSGTGLGLAMCKRMVEQAGGDIRYETSEAGTSFYVTFPLVKS
jgi:signal transduction histidine kinase